MLRCTTWPAGHSDRYGAGYTEMMGTVSTVSWRRGTVCLGAAFLALAGCVRPPADPLTEGTRAIQRENVTAYGRYLAADARAGRHHASPEADSVVSYLLTQLERMGIGGTARAQELRGPRAVSFVHHFSVFLHRLGPATRLAVFDGTAHHEAAAGPDFRPLLFSTEADVLARSTVLQARAEDLVEAAAAAVRGRVVFVPPTALAGRSGEPADAKYYRASRRLSQCGAAAAVFTEAADWHSLSGASYPSELPPEMASGVRSPRGIRLNLTASRLGAALQAAAWRVAPERTIPALVVRPGALPMALEGAETRVQVEFRAEVSLGQNLLVGFGGAGGGEECILLLAHYDHSGVNSAGEVLNGADDNASGVAALLEVARAFAQVHDTLHRSVLLAFVSAEMQGGQGIEALLQDLPLLLGRLQVRACFVLDAVGSSDPDYLAVHGADAHSDLLRLLERHNRRATLLAPALLLAPRSRSRLPERFAASWPHAATGELLQRAGIPSLLFNDGLDPLLYGQPEDDWEGVDAAKLTRVARLLFAAAWELASPRGNAALPATSP